MAAASGPFNQVLNASAVETVLSLPIRALALMQTGFASCGPWGLLGADMSVLSMCGVCCTGGRSV